MQHVRGTPQLSDAQLRERVDAARALLEKERTAEGGSDHTDNPFDVELAQLLAMHLQPIGATTQLGPVSPHSMAAAAPSPSLSDRHDALALTPVAAPALDGFPPRCAFRRKPWFHLCRAVLVVVLYELLCRWIW